MFKKKRVTRSSLKSHIFWGAVSGVAAVWVANKYRKGLPDEARQKVDETLDGLSPLAGYESSIGSNENYRNLAPYGIGAGFGALYGVSTFYFPFLKQIRRFVFSLLTWSFGATKVASLLGLVEDTQHKSASEKAIALASRSAFKYGLDQSFRRAER